MSAADLRAWQARMGYTYTSASAALGMARSCYALMLAGKSRIDRRTALACAAIEAGITVLYTNTAESA